MNTVLMFIAWTTGRRNPSEWKVKKVYCVVVFNNTIFMFGISCLENPLDYKLMPKIRVAVRKRPRNKKEKVASTTTQSTPPTFCMFSNVVKVILSQSETHNVSCMNPSNFAHNVALFN